MTSPVLELQEANARSSFARAALVVMLLCVSCTDRVAVTPVLTMSPSPPKRAPLVFAVHSTRPPLDLSRAHADALVARRPVRWSELGQAGGAVRVVSGASAVERDRDALAVTSAYDVGPTVRVARVDGVDPFLEPDRYPLKTEGAAPPRATVVFGVGDVMMGGGVDRLLRARGDFSSPLRHVRARLADADITFGTLESSLSRAGSPQQPAGENFAADPRVLPGLRAAGFDVLSVGNNHSGDFGPRALVETVERLRAARIRPVGAGANDTEARRAVVIERNGARFGFYAFNGRGETPAATASRPGAVRLRMAPYDPFSPSDLARIVGDVRALDGRVDVVIVLPHWGRQYTHRQNADQRRVGRALVDAGADAVIGSHPHWVQGVESIGDAFVAYSLGNFIFSQNIFLPQTRQNVSVEMTFWGADLKRVELIPGRIESDYAARFLSSSAGRATLNDVWSNSLGPFKN